MDRSAGVIPEKMGGALIAATPSCVAVGTREEHDGDTSISLSDEGTPGDIGSDPVFEGFVETPSKVLSVCSVLDEVFLELPVPAERTRLRIWANDPVEPDVIAITIVP